MSTLKTNACQLGQSGTASNNFTWYQPASPDGTVRLGQGNSGATTQDVIKCDSSGNMTIPGSIYQAGGTTAAGRVVLATPQAASGLTDVEFASLPSWVKKITMTFAGAGNQTYGNGLSIYLGTSVGYVTSGYNGGFRYSVGASSSGASFGSGAGIYLNWGSNGPYDNGEASFTLVSSSSNIWAFSGNLGSSGAQMSFYGYVTITNVLTKIKASITGAATFDQGTINVFYEG